MNNKTRNLIYNIINPAYAIIIKKNHVTFDELNEIYRVMELIHQKNVFYTTHNIEYDNYLMFNELCSIKNKKYLKYIDRNLMDYCTSLYTRIGDATTLVSVFKNYVDYGKNGNNIYVYMSKVLWYNYYINNDDITNDNNLPYYLKEYFIAKNDIDSMKDYYGKNYINFGNFVLIYLTYLYMNQDKYDKELFIEGYNMMIDKQYYNHMLLNGTFNGERNDNMKIKMFFINEIINTINNKKNK